MSLPTAEAQREQKKKRQKRRQKVLIWLFLGSMILPGLIGFISFLVARFIS